MALVEIAAQLAELNETFRINRQPLTQPTPEPNLLAQSFDVKHDKGCSFVADGIVCDCGAWENRAAEISAAAQPTPAQEPAELRIPGDLAQAYWWAKDADSGLMPAAWTGKFVVALIERIARLESAEPIEGIRQIVSNLDAADPSKTASQSFLLNHIAARLEGR